MFGMNMQHISPLNFMHKSFGLGLNSIYLVIIIQQKTFIQCHVRQDLTVSIKLIFKSSPVVQC